MKSLGELYWQEHGIEGLDIEKFLAAVQAGTYGPYSQDQIRAFLIEMESSILQNIESKAGEAPQFALMKDEIVQQTVEQFIELRAKYAGE